MTRLTYVLVGFVVALVLFSVVGAQTAAEQKTKPGLFINLTTDDTWAATKAIHFAHERVLLTGHGPVTIWLNVRAVNLGDKTVPAHTHGLTGENIHAMLQSFIEDGGTVIACRVCAKAAGVTEDDLIDGVVMGHPDIVMPALFGDDVRTLSW
jgi:sulfur relay (sulfurtransferase) complex TusBCD TusD component (DsrE family)